MTVGIDLAAEPKNTAVATIEWTRGRALVRALASGATDDGIVDAVTGATKIGIDCPLGWPSAFVQFVTDHRDGAARAPADSIDARRRLAYRRTDLLTTERHGLRPLSVAADRIGHAALRCAGVLARLGELDRSGLGRVVEVYPAGSLRQWDLPYRRYKGPAGRENRARIVDALDPVVDVGRFRDRCVCVDHDLDAVVAAISAYAAHLGLATLPSVEELPVARVEGWIALPTCTLSELARPT